MQALSDHQQQGEGLIRPLLGCFCTAASLLSRLSLSPHRPTVSVLSLHAAGVLTLALLSCTYLCACQLLKSKPFLSLLAPVLESLFFLEKQCMCSEGRHRVLVPLTPSPLQVSLQNYSHQLKISQAVPLEKAKKDYSTEVNSFQINPQDQQAQAV